MPKAHFMIKSIWLIGVISILLIMIRIPALTAKVQTDEEYWKLETNLIKLNIGKNELIQINLERAGTETLANLNITINVPKGMEPDVQKDGTVIAKINNECWSSKNIYDTERRILHWNISDASFIGKFLRVELNVSVSENLKEKEKIDFIIACKINNFTFTRNFNIFVEILRPKLELETEFKDGNISVIIRNNGNGRKKIQYLFFNFSIPISFDIRDIIIVFPNSTLRKIEPTQTIYNEQVSDFYVNPNESILIRFKIVANDVSKLKSWEDVKMIIKINEEEFSKSIRFETRIRIESLNFISDGIIQNVTLMALISGNSSLKFNLTSNGPLRIELPPDLCVIEKITYFEINNIDLTSKAKLIDNVIIIDNYTIIIPSRIVLNVIVKIQPQYENNPRLGASILLSQSVSDRKEYGRKITIFKNVRVERMFGFLPYFYDVRIDDTKVVNGSLTLHVGSNKYNLTIVNNKGTLILFKEAFWPLFEKILIKAEAEDEACLSEDGSIAKYYIKVSETLSVFTGMGILIIIAPLIPTVTFLWIRRKHKMRFPPSPLPQLPLEEEYDLG